MSGNRTLWLVLAYLGPLALIPFLLEKDDQEVQWHSKHGLVLFLAELAVGILLGIGNVVIGMVFGDCLGIIGAFGGCFVSVVLFVAIVVLHVMCIMKALDGKRLLIPNLSQYADKF
ncbi:MAG: hypothetical protein MI919_31130 [Holophagales bacterium]|nr:hypothetical protein [Holophagales bacterium]